MLTGWLDGTGSRSGVAARAASHNGATEPGKLKVTIWGETRKKPRREMTLVLGEEDVKRLKANLERFGL